MAGENGPTPDATTAQPVIEHFRDYATIRWTREERYAIRFEVFEIIGSDHPSGAPLYHRKGAAMSEDVVESIDEADLYLKAEVRFDGCSHWDIGEGGYVHLCGAREVGRFSGIFPALMEIAARFFPDCREATA